MGYTTGVGLLVFATLSVFMRYAYTAPSQIHQVCQTNDCKIAAERLLNSMNKKYNPCDNFYEFACGGYTKTHPVPEGRNMFDGFDKAEDVSRERLKEILERDDPQDNNFEGLSQAKLMYEICMRGRDDILIMRKVINELGGWPILNGQQTNRHWSSVDLTDLIARLTLYSVDVIVTSSVAANPYNTSVNVIQVDQDSLILGRGYLNELSFNDKLMAAYRKYILNVAQAIGLPNDNMVDQDIIDLIEFETNVTMLTSPEDFRTNSTILYKKMTMDELQSRTDPNFEVFNWKRYLDYLCQEDLPGHTMLVVSELDFFVEVFNLIKSSPRKAVLNYLIWAFIVKFSWDTGGQVAEARYQFKQVLDGITSGGPRWKVCIQRVESAWGLAVAAPYVDKYFSSKSREEVNEMINYIYAAFVSRLQDADFMDDETKRVAKEKANAMIWLVGYPDELNSSLEISYYYESYPTMGNSHLYNVLQIKVALVKDEFAFWNEPTIRDSFNIMPTHANAMYTPTSNSITIPAGILQPPFFAVGLPKACNYGAIGFIIGHELTHGFDNDGSHYDKDGNLRKWWPQSVFDAFHNKTKCFEKQYNNYCPELQNKDLCINGITTLDENIADNGGLEEAYHAYHSWLVQHGSDILLPGLEEFTSDQLFFLSMANPMCTSVNEAGLIYQLMYDEHSLNKYRVIGTVSNSPEFAAAFKCPEIPENRCTVW